MRQLVDVSTERRAQQLTRFRELWTNGRSEFYTRKYPHPWNPADIQTWNQFTQLPCTRKRELVEFQRDSADGLCRGTPVRLHQTSGTSTGQPLRWHDTAKSWHWILHCWQGHYRLMGITPEDRAFFAFSFGPFLGFWSSFEAATQAGILAMPGGGMSTTARLKYLIEQHATVVFCTPTYALHLAEVASQTQIQLNGKVRALVLAGEPGAGVPATRQKIEQAWGARVFDHYGLTEVGPVASEPVDSPGNLAILEDEYIAEVLATDSDDEVPDGTPGELVLTNLGRVGSPIVRYRTGDIVRKSGSLLLGGILGRADDMIHIRGNNVYPSAIEAVLFRFPEVVEFSIHVDQLNPLADLRIIVEPLASAMVDEANLKYNIERAIRDELLFRADVTIVPPGTLPRSEMKSHRLKRPNPH